jgi:uncharacterized membrane protein YkgB
MNRLCARLDRLEALVTRWLARYSVDLLRVSLGVVFLGFGVLKFFPGVSPAQGLAEEAVAALTLGLIPGSVGLVLVATIETVIGLSLITGRYVHLGLVWLGVAMVGILSPLVLVPSELFARPYEPTLEGQYVLKDLVLIAAGLVVATSVRLRRSVVSRDEPASERTVRVLSGEHSE